MARASVIVVLLALAASACADEPSSRHTGAEEPSSTRDGTIQTPPIIIVTKTEITYHEGSKLVAPAVYLGMSANLSSAAMPPQTDAVADSTSDTTATSATPRPHREVLRDEPIAKDPRAANHGVSWLFVVTCATFVLVLAFMIVTMNRRPREPGESISLLLAEAVARIVVRHRLWTALAAIAGVVALHAIDQDDAAIMIANVAALQLAQLLVARAAVARIERAVLAERRGEWLYVGGAYLRASGRIFDAARRHNVPRVEQV